MRRTTKFMPDRSINRRIFLTAAAVAGLASLTGCGFFSQRFPTYRYRLTVEVDTPAGLRTGSSVIEVHSLKSGELAIPTPKQLFFKVKGEAVAVDLPGGQTLFALLSTAQSVDAASGYAMTGLRPSERRTGPDAYEGDLAELVKRRDIGVLPANWYPTLVHFSDIKDPKTVEAVDPANLAASFGPGVALRRITVQITDDPVTTGIEERLKWLGKFPEPSLDPSHTPTDFSLPATLHHGDFRRLAQ